jgi:hypothetical protein
LSPDITSLPSGDSSPLEWDEYGAGSAHYDKINEGMGSKETTNRILGVCSFIPRDQHSYPADAPGNMDEATLVTMQLYYKGLNVGGGPSNNPQLRVSLWVGAVSKGESVWDGNTGGAYQVRNFPTTPTLPLSPSEYDSLQVRFKANFGTGLIPIELP